MGGGLGGGQLGAYGGGQLGQVGSLGGQFGMSGSVPGHGNTSPFSPVANDTNGDPVYWTNGSRQPPPAPAGYRYAGSVIVKNFVLEYDGVPPQLADLPGNVVQLKSETIVRKDKNGNALKSDVIVSDYFVTEEDYRNYLKELAKLLLVC
jgi:hypothetical protein